MLLRPAQILIFFLISFVSFAQKETNNWFFGHGAGVTFNSGSPVSVNGGKIYSIEGCASISGRNGNLLFYTNGETVYDRAHTKMFNGGGLRGFQSASQSCVIIPNPCDTTIFYLFTIDGNTLDTDSGIQGPKYLGEVNYNIIDISQNGGLGAVTSKNNFLMKVAYESIAAVHHANGKDAWVMAHEYTTNKFYAFPVTSAGVGTPVITAIGPNNFDLMGRYMKFSPNGKMLAYSINGTHIYDFDNATGVLSNDRDLSTTFTSFYGISFSPNSQFLYASDCGTYMNCAIVQYNVTFASVAAILASKAVLAIGATWPINSQALQIGSDGKIYAVRTSSLTVGYDSLGVITNPDLAYPGCSYSNKGCYLGPVWTGIYGLPNFIESYFAPGYQSPQSGTSLTATFSNDTSVCSGNAITLGVNATGGVPSYQYSWSNGQTTQQISFTPTVDTFIVAQVNDGCVGLVLDTIFISSSVAQQYPLFTNDIDCFGMNNGMITADTSLGTGPFTYVWSPGISQTSGMVTGLLPGTYSVTVTDGNGCTSQNNATISEPNLLLITLTQVQPTWGNSDGSITVNANGGNGSYTYLWGGGQTLSSLNNIASSSYSVLVTDAKGCTNDTVINLPCISGVCANPPYISHLGNTPEACGNSNGDITTSVTNGTKPYTYNWSSGNPAIDSIATGLQAGTYTLIVVDNAGCSDTLITTVTGTPGFSPQITYTKQDKCYVPTTGVAVVDPNGGTAPYTYNWQPGGVNNDTIVGLIAGVYTVNIIDNNGCTGSATVTMTQPPPITMDTIVVNTSCAQANGSAIINASGGTGVLSYSWQTGSTSNLVSGLASGTYTFQVTDANNCVKTSSAIIGNSAGLALIAVTIDSVLCFGDNNGVITVVPNTTQLPVTYTWSSGSSVSVASNLAAGTYSVSITDNAGCSVDTFFVVASPTVLQANANGSFVSCSPTDGSVVAWAAGGTGSYQYSWNSGATNASQSGLPAGTYSVIITDAKGCTSDTSVTITPLTTFSITATVKDESCSNTIDGSIAAQTQPLTSPNFYSWSNGATGYSISGLTAGTYTLVVVDNYFCPDTAIVTVSQLSGPTVDAGVGSEMFIGESISLSATSTTASTFSWQPASDLSCNNCQSPNATPDVTTTYTVLVTDVNGCTAIDSVEVIVKTDCAEFFIPTAFSPNGDNENDELIVRGSCIKNFELRIYNRWGEIVFQTSNSKATWDGLLNGKQCNPGVYVYYLTGISFRGEAIDLKGNITLVR